MKTTNRIRVACGIILSVFAVVNYFSGNILAGVSCNVCSAALLFMFDD